MSLPLCTPEKIECVIKVKDEVKDEECLPQCSGLWVNSYSWFILGNKKIRDLSKHYWNYKGFYEFPSYKGMGQFTTFGSFSLGCKPKAK